MALQAALRPAHVKDMRVLGKAVEEWEIKCAALAQDHKEGFTERVNVAALINIIPRDLHGISGHGLRFVCGREGAQLQGDPRQDYGCRGQQDPGESPNANGD